MQVNYTATHARHLRQSTVAQARQIAAAAPGTKVLAYQQGFLAMNCSDAEYEAMQDPSKGGWWTRNADGSVTQWDTAACPGNSDWRCRGPGSTPAGGKDYCAYGQRCARIYNASLPEVRSWFIDKVALPTLAEPTIAGLQVDNTMRAPEETEDCGPECFALLQRGAADLHRELGELMRAKHPVRPTTLLHSLTPEPWPECHTGRHSHKAPKRSLMAV